MELSGEEKKIQALFSELKAADAQAAPRFAGVWNRAIKPARGRSFNPVFVAAMALLVCAVLSVAVWTRYQRQIQTPEVVRVDTPVAPAPASSAGPSTINPTAAQAKDPSKGSIAPRRKKPAMRSNPTQLATNRKLTQDAKAITDWESPTSALLSSPSDSLFSSLPQLNENANGLQSYLPSRPQ